jgi:hypothetical protein
MIFLFFKNYNSLNLPILKQLLNRLQKRLKPYITFKATRIQEEDQTALSQNAYLSKFAFRI